MLAENYPRGKGIVQLHTLDSGSSSGRAISGGSHPGELSVRVMPIRPFGVILMVSGLPALTYAHSQGPLALGAAGPRHT